METALRVSKLPRLLFYEYDEALLIVRPMTQKPVKGRPSGLRLRPNEAASWSSVSGSGPILSSERLGHLVVLSCLPPGVVLMSPEEVRRDKEEEVKKAVRKRAKNRLAAQEAKIDRAKRRAAYQYERFLEDALESIGQGDWP
jgi:hypothetical protein